MFFRITGARWHGLSIAKKTKDRRETSSVSRIESLARPCGRVSVFKSGPARAGHQPSGAERFILAIITIELPAPQTAAGIDNFPAGAAENALNFSGRSLQHQPTMERTLRFRGSGKMRDQHSAATAWSRRETVRASIVTNVIAAVDRRCDSPITLFHHRTKKITRISSAAQPRFAYSSRVKAALESESTFFGRVVKCADDEIFAGVTLRAPGEFFIFVGKPLHHFRPRNISAGQRQDRYRPGGGRGAD